MHHFLFHSIPRLPNIPQVPSHDQPYSVACIVLSTPLLIAISSSYLFRCKFTEVDRLEHVHQMACTALTPKSEGGFPVSVMHLGHSVRVSAALAAAVDVVFRLENTL